MVKIVRLKEFVNERFVALYPDRFPNNFVVLKNDKSRYGAAVVCVSDFIFDEETRTTGEVTIVGHEFKRMKPSWDFGRGGLSYARFHSYVVDDVDRNSSFWKGSKMIEKGTALNLKLLESVDDKLTGREVDQSWVVHLLDHCLP